MQLGGCARSGEKPEERKRMDCSGNSRRNGDRLYISCGSVLPADRRHLLPVARLFLLLLPLDILNQVLLAVEHGRMRWRRYNLLRLSFFLFYLILIGFIGGTRRNQVRWFVLAFLASQLLAALLRFWIQRKSLATGKLRFDGCRHLLCAG